MATKKQKRAALLLDVSKMIAPAGRRYIVRTGSFAGNWGRGDSLGEAVRNAIANGATLRDSFIVYEVDMFATVNEMGGITRPGNSAESVHVATYYAAAKDQPKDARYIIVAREDRHENRYRTQSATWTEDARKAETLTRAEVGERLKQARAEMTDAEVTATRVER